MTADAGWKGEHTMIRGMGSDIVAIVRIERDLQRFGERLPRRVLSAAEWQSYAATRFPASFVARRFAAKEAVAKGLGTGFSEGVAPHDIAIVHDGRGAPAVRYAGAAERRRRALGVAQTWLSISDERDYAVAFAVLV